MYAFCVKAFARSKDETVEFVRTLKKGKSSAVEEYDFTNCLPQLGTYLPESNGQSLRFLLIYTSLAYPTTELNQLEFFRKVGVTFDIIYWLPNKEVDISKASVIVYVRLLFGNMNYFTIHFFFRNLRHKCSFKKLLVMGPRAVILRRRTRKSLLTRLLFFLLIRGLEIIHFICRHFVKSPNVLTLANIHDFASFLNYQCRLGFGVAKDAIPVS